MARQDRDIDWDCDEFHLACSKLDAAPDGVQIIDPKEWHDQNKRFEKGTRNLIQRLKRRGLIPTE